MHPDRSPITFAARHFGGRRKRRAAGACTDALPFPMAFGPRVAGLIPPKSIGKLGSHQAHQGTAEERARRNHRTGLRSTPMARIMLRVEERAGSVALQLDEAGLS